MNAESRPGFDHTAHAQEHADSDSVPYDDVSQDAMADKLGSYFQARYRLAIQQPTVNLRADAITARIDTDRAPMSPRAKSTRRYVQGPQLSEESLPVVDQRLDSEQAVHQHEQLTEKVQPVLQALAVQRVRRRAEHEGEDPDRAERLYRRTHQV